MNRSTGVDRSFSPRDRVEVRSRFSGAWVSGFEVVSAHSAGCRLRRLSDGSVLPATFACRDVRRADIVRDEDASPQPCADLLFDRGDMSRLLIALPGVLDIATVEAIRGPLLRAIDAPTDEVVLDLTRVEFLDSYGVRLLVMARRRTWERDVKLVLRDGKPLVRALLDLVGIDPMYHAQHRARGSRSSATDNEH